jgi:hypothetical protein
MIDENYCKRSGCESSIGKCGYYPKDCVINALRRDLENLIMMFDDKSRHPSNHLDIATSNQLEKSKKLMILVRELEQ